MLGVCIAVVLLLVTSQSVRSQEGAHVVRAGERLADIALAYDVDVYDLTSVNNIDNPDLIVPGLHLLIPGTRQANPYGARALNFELPGESGYYEVQVGDSLSTIAIRYEMPLADLMRLNGLEDPSSIWIGQRLRVSARAEPVTPNASQEPALARADQIYVVEAGDSLSEIGQNYGVSTEELLNANGLTNVNMLFPGQRLRVPASRAVRDAEATIAGAPVDGERSIEIDLSDQTLRAWQGDVEIFHTTVSTGKGETPTVVGTFEIGTKYQRQDMYGDDYYLPGVPWVMYFYEAFAIHGAYWHANFGTPTSHGCVNMRPDEAGFLFAWATIGTEVTVHE